MLFFINDPECPLFLPAGICLPTANWRWMTSEYRFLKSADAFILLRRTLRREKKDSCVRLKFNKGEEQFECRSAEPQFLVISLNIYNKCCAERPNYKNKLLRHSFHHFTTPRFFIDADPENNALDRIIILSWERPFFREFYRFA